MNTKSWDWINVIFETEVEYETREIPKSDQDLKLILFFFR